MLQFITDECNTRRDCEAGAKDLYESYKAWCKRNVLEAMSGQLFGRRMGNDTEKLRNG